MPRRTDLETILIIGSGPIVIGQACEFDYSGTQACKVLREEGYRVVLVNSNPATIMTDPDFADRTYVEPLVPEILEKIIEKERPDALLPTMGGQTALNLAVELAESGALARRGVELIGADLSAIKKAEDRELFKKAMADIGLEVPKSGIARDMERAWAVADSIGFPVIIRPSFTLGGTGGSVAYNREEFAEFAKSGMESSPSGEILVEESIVGWKEFEYEVMRDRMDNVVIICSIENFDPMGVHTGDSVTVAPAQTLTDKEYQRMRDASVAIIREIGVDTGGSNIQFAVNPSDGRVMVIEMNPRVSRSSALASKATGFPIAKMAAKLAVGYSLDEIANDITKTTPASFEPTMDYVVVKVPRFAFEKFPGTDPVLTTQMKSVGEVMSMGRTFREALQKAVRSLETGDAGLGKTTDDPEEVREKLRVAAPRRLWHIADAFRLGLSLEEVHSICRVDPWFLLNIKRITDFEPVIERAGLRAETVREAKRMGFSDAEISRILHVEEDRVRDFRAGEGIEPAFKMVDTCAAEFESRTPYLYSTFESESEAPPAAGRKVVILGGGPNRIGQGIEFDYCCAHASFALREEGYEAVMVNCNPETVSTDYDTSDRLYFEPLTLEDTLAVVKRENPEGVIVHLGGQTPLRLAMDLERRGARILGTSPESIDLAEDRDRFSRLVSDLGLLQPRSGTATSEARALDVARSIGYPVMVRPSYVLGGRAMETVYDERSLVSYMREAVSVSPNHPVLIDKFLKDAREVDVDAVCDGRTVVVAGVLEHIEEAGVHSGDSAAVFPPFSMSSEVVDEIKSQTRKLALALGVRGLVNVQFAVKDGRIYVIEVNPRASRTVPFVSKAIGVQLARIGTKVMLGRSLAELGYTEEVFPEHYCVKESVFPFAKFPEVDTILGPEMKSTGEVMGIDPDVDQAFAKSQMAAGNSLPSSGTAFISVKDEDKRAETVDVASRLSDAGFEIVATGGTSEFLGKNGILSEKVKKIGEGRPHVVDHLKNGDVQLVINTTFGKSEIAQSYLIRRTALMRGVPYFTTIAGAAAGTGAIASLARRDLNVRALQNYYRRSGRADGAGEVSG